MDDRFTQLSFKYLSPKGIIEICCQPGLPRCQYRMSREGQEVIASRQVYDDGDRALRDALTFLLVTA